MASTHIDENQFYREVTMRICGSLEIDKALYQCFLYIKDIIPADELIMTVYNSETHTIDVVATADIDGGQMRFEGVPMPTYIRKQLEEPLKFPRVRVSEDVYKDEIVGRIAENYRWPVSSIIVGRLIVEDKFVGSFIVRKEGKGTYNETHAKLWSIINEPAAIALANSLRYFELMRLKELLADDSKYFQHELRKDFTEEIVGAEFGLKEVMNQVLKVAPLSSPVLLIGETGTGKELIANAIHNFSPRNNGPLIKVNCGAIPETLIDSELFGHEKGAFTGAISRQRGRFERANGGTIFLDEVSELPLNAQVRLLRVLQEKEIERVGGTQPIKVDVRVISATNKDLKTLVEKKLFRDDLYYRLCVVPIRIPPLRERKTDIPALVDYFIRRKSKEMGLNFIPTLAPGTLEKLLQYHWPGNVRELSNAIERAIIIHGNRPLSFDDIIGIQTFEKKAVNELDVVPNDMTLKNMEIQHIKNALRLAKGKIEGKNGAAAILGMNPATLRSKMRRLKIPFGRTMRSEYL
ncbi:MAG: sigma-54 dependent transcriptional regulator [Syntrophorhabdaceae bacterium]|nr:sigma-54 dependent transcriptional regulator [Syntrophorhabdaceae bacterium]